MTTHFAACGLCLEPKELRDSHLLPRALYKQSRDSTGGADPNPVVITQSKTITSSQQVSSYFLCESCEQRFSDNGERYVVAQCARSDGSFKLREQILAASPLHDTPKFKVYDVQSLLDSKIDHYLYFAASIFWRASAHRWKMGAEPVGQISLGDKYEEQFRLYLVGKAALPKNARLHVHVSSEAQSDLMSTVFPCTTRIDKARRHQFYIPGLLFLLFLSGDVSREIDNGALNGSLMQVVWLCPWENEALFRGSMEVIKSSRPSGKLRR